MVNPLKKIKICFSSAILGAVLSLFSHCALAITCTNSLGGASLKPLINIDSPVSISTANLAPGTVVWHSQTLQAMLICNGNTAENTQVWLNLNPLHQIEQIDPSLQVFVNYNGSDRILNYNDIVITPNQLQCHTDFCNSGIFYIEYSVLIKTTGKSPPASGNISNVGQYALFNVGSAHDNNPLSPTVTYYLSGLNNIHFTSCQPQINVVANNGAAVDFGSIQAHNAQAGKTEKQVPFSVQANLTNAGQDCEGKAMNVSFSTTNATSGTDMILPGADSGFGISVAPANAPNSFIPLNTNVALGYINGSVAKNDFIASLRWLNNSPKTGVFRATANVDVTFK